MIKQFLSFEWKQFKRSASFQKGIGIKILLAIGAIYFGGAALLMGIGLYFILKKQLPDSDPLVLFNNFLIYIVVFDLVVRFFMHQLPVMNVKPYMTIPVKRSTVINYLLGKTCFSFFNILPLFIYIPFSVVLIVKGYSSLNVVLWFVSLVAITLTTNFINFLINKNNTFFYLLLSVVVLFGGLQYFKIYDVTIIMGKAFNALYSQPYLVVLPLLVVFALYKLNYTLIYKGFYLDDAISKKAEKVKAQEFSFLNRFGAVAPFLKNDIKLIWRNVRPRQVLIMSFFFLFYGLIFYTQDTYKNMPVMLAFASMFVTGGFLISFGQLVPSWDSEYYKLLMSQNIPYKQYLLSKWYLMAFACLVSFILATPYVYFGWDIYFMIVAGALFNIGLNSFITLFGGALNRVPVELNVKAKAFSNTNGFSVTQLLMSLPKVVLPMLLFYLPYKLINFNAGLITLGLSGVLGIVFRKAILNKIEQVYQKGKYKTIAAYSEKK